MTVASKKPRKKDAWMPLYIGDYLRDTSRLTTEQHGAYLLLIMDYWVNGPLPDEDGALAAIVKMTPAQWKKAKPGIAAFFVVKDGKWQHKRIDAERERAKTISENRKQAGREGADRRWGHDSKPDGNEDGKSDGKAIANPSENGWQNDRPSPSPSPSPSETGSNSEPSPEKSSAQGGDYAFSGQTVRLNQRDFDAWARLYTGIPDLRAELAAIDAWWQGQDPAKQKRWFQATSGMLNRKHQEAIERRKNGKAGGHTPFQAGGL